MKDKISIIVPVYNVEKYLSECLDSIVNQTYKNIEIILINDGSTDSSLEICKKYQKKDKRILLIDQKNGGVSKARNAGLKKATGKYILFVDSDDYLELNAIELIVSCIYKDTLLIFGYNKVYKNKIIKMCEEELIIDTKHDMEKFMFLNSNIGTYIANKLFSRKIIDENNLVFNESLSVGEDVVFILEYIKYCSKYKYISYSFYNYRIRKSSASQCYLTRDNSSVLITYDLLLKMVNDKDSINNIKYRYLESYYIFKKYLKGYVPNIDILNQEKEIIKNNCSTIISKIRFVVIKYFYNIGLIYKKIESIKYKFFD